METIIKKIEEYNNAVKQVFEEDDYEYYKLAELTSASEDDTKELETLMGLPIPDRLKSLYKKVGHITNLENNESHCILISEPKVLIENTKESFSESYSDRALSFGLIDTIICEWGFDRPEFQEYEYLTEAETKDINDKYKCFGLWRNDDILEGAYYLFFDKNGNFGQLYYHQDDINETISNLNHLLKNGISEDHSLEDILINAIDTARETMIEWNEN